MFNYWLRSVFQKLIFLSLLCSWLSWVLPRWQCSWRLMDLYRLESDFTIETWNVLCICICWKYLPYLTTIEHIFVAYDKLVLMPGGVNGKRGSCEEIKTTFWPCFPRVATLVQVSFCWSIQVWLIQIVGWRVTQICVEEKARWPPPADEPLQFG